MDRILVAEDSADIGEILQIGLSQKGFEVVLARDGLQARDIALSGGIDLAILDILMPQLSGIEVLRQMRAAPQRQIPVILLSALIAPPEQARGFAAGANAYIIKPFHLKEVVGEVRKLLPPHP